MIRLNSQSEQLPKQSQNPLRHSLEKKNLKINLSRNSIQMNVSYAILKGLFYFFIIWEKSKKNIIKSTLEL